MIFGPWQVVPRKEQYCCFLRGTPRIFTISMFYIWNPRKQWQIIGSKAKRRISKRVFQENKARQIFWKANISYPLIRRHTCLYLYHKCSFIGKFGVLCFLETPVLRFVFLSYYRQNQNQLTSSGYCPRLLLPQNNKDFQNKNTWNMRD